MLKKKKKSSTKTLSLYKKKLWDLFSRHVRKSYADDFGYSKCYTCESVLHWKELQCGHAIGGRNNAVLFDKEICRPQCFRCNISLRGNYTIFTTKLILENGMDWWLKKLAGARETIKRTRVELIEMIEQYQGEVNE